MAEVTTTDGKPPVTGGTVIIHLPTGPVQGTFNGGNGGNIHTPTNTYPTNP